MLQSLRMHALRLHADARGLTTVEYTIVLCLIAALCVGIWKEFGGHVKDSITDSNDKINSALTGEGG